MAFNKYGFRTLDFIGSIDGSAGTNRQIHGYVTNDDAAGVETANYFDDVVDRLKVGDIIFASLDLDGTPVGRIYNVSAISSGHATIKAFEATAISAG